MSVKPGLPRGGTRYEYQTTQRFPTTITVRGIQVRFLSGAGTRWGRDNKPQWITRKAAARKLWAARKQGYHISRSRTL